MEFQFETRDVIKSEKVKKDDEELFNADPNCEHKIVSASGGGIKCIKCNGWFCF